MVWAHCLNTALATLPDPAFFTHLFCFPPPTGPRLLESTETTSRSSFTDLELNKCSLNALVRIAFDNWRNVYGSEGSAWSCVSPEGRVGGPRPGKPSVYSSRQGKPSWLTSATDHKKNSGQTKNTAPELSARTTRQEGGGMSNMHRPPVWAGLPLSPSRLHRVAWAAHTEHCGSASTAATSIETPSF